MVKVIIADDSNPIRERIIKLLSDLPNVEIVGEAIDGVETAVIVRKTHPDVVILDLQMPKLSGLSTIPELRQINPNIKIIGMTGSMLENLKY